MPRIITLPDGTKATLPDAMPDDKIPDFVDQYMKSRMTEKSVGGLVPANRPEAFQTQPPGPMPTDEDARREMTSKFLGTLDPSARPEGWDAQMGMIMATTVPGFGTLGLVARSGLIASGGTLGSLYEDARYRLFGEGPKRSLKETAIKAGASWAIGLASELLPVGAARGFSLGGKALLKVLVGPKPSVEVGGLAKWAVDQGLDVNVLDYTQGILQSVKRFHEASAFGGPKAGRRRNRYYAKYSELVDKSLDAIAASPGDIEAGRLVTKGIDAAHDAATTLDNAHFEGILSDAGDDAIVELGAEKLTEVSKLAETVSKLSKEIPGIDKEAGAVTDLIHIFSRKKTAVGGKGAGKFTPENTLAMLEAARSRARQFPDEGYYAQVADAMDMLVGEKGELKTITPRVAHRLQSVLGSMAFHAKSLSLKKVILESQGMVRDSIVDAVGPGLGNEYMEAIAYSRKYRKLFDGKLITELMNKSPEDVINWVRLGTATSRESDYSKFEAVRNALLEYGKNPKGWRLFKRRILENEVRFSGRVTEGQAPLSPMEDLLAGLQNTGDNFRYNKKVISEFFNEPEDRAAIEGFSKAAQIIRLQGMPLQAPKASHYGIYYALHLATLAGGGLLFSGGHAIAGVGLGLLSVALTPGFITRVMYTPQAQKYFLESLEGMVRRRAQDKMPTGAQIDMMMRAFVLGAFGTTRKQTSEERTTSENQRRLMTEKLLGGLVPSKKP